MPKKYCLGLNFKCNWARHVFVCHIWQPCAHTARTFLRVPSEAHTVHTDMLSTGRAACPAVEPAPARAQETSHAPLLPSSLSPQVPQGSVYTPRAWGCFLGPVPPQFLWEPAWLAAWSGSRGLGHGFPLAQPAAAPPPRPRGLPVPHRVSVASWPAGGLPPSRPLPSGSPAAHILVYGPRQREGLQAECSEVFIGISVKMGRGSLGPSGDALLGLALQTAPQTPPTAPRRPAAISRGIWEESGFSGRGLCLAWQRLRSSRCSPRGPERPLGGGGGGEPSPTAAGTQTRFVSAEQVERRELGPRCSGDPLELEDVKTQIKTTPRWLHLGNPRSLAGEKIEWLPLNYRQLLRDPGERGRWD